MAGKSKAGMICGFCGIIATIAVTVFSFYYVLTNPTMRSYIEYYVQMYTGEEDFDLEEMLEDIIPGYLGADDNSSNDNVTPDENTPSDDLYEIPSGEEAVPPVEIPQEGGKFL